jgi:hypothetical protein
MMSRQRVDPSRLATALPTRSTIRLRALSLGAGIQSATLARIAAHGIIDPMPDYAVFADTGWKPTVVYDHLASLTSANVLPFPVYIVSAGNIRENLISAARDQRWASIPAFTRAVNRPRPSAVLAGVFLPSIVVT